MTAGSGVRCPAIGSSVRPLPPTGLRIASGLSEARSSFLCDLWDARTLWNVSRGWQALWWSAALLGVVSLVLGLIQWTFNHRPGGPNYEYGWVLFGVVLLLLPLGAFGMAKWDVLDNDGRKQRVYAVAAIIVLALGVAAWQVKAIDLPWVQDRDLPFLGEGVAEGL